MPGRPPAAEVPRAAARAMAAASGYTDLREKLKSMTSRDNYKAGSREAAAAAAAAVAAAAAAAAAAEPYAASGANRKYPEDSDPERSDFEQQLQEGGGARKVKSGIRQMRLFSQDECAKIEGPHRKGGVPRREGWRSEHTVDRAPLRSKYFFGEGYVRRCSCRSAGPARGASTRPATWTRSPNGCTQLVIQKLVSTRHPRGLRQQRRHQRHQPGGCIVSHVDPIHIFERPIIVRVLHLPATPCALLWLQVPVQAYPGVGACAFPAGAQGERDCAQVTAWEEGGGRGPRKL